MAEMPKTPKPPKAFQEMAPELARRLLASQRPLLVGHVGADGDSLGSMAALALALRRVGASPRLALHEAPVERYAWLLEGLPTERLDLARNPQAVLDAVDLVVLLDLSELHRCGRLARPISERDLQEVLVIDHHLCEHAIGPLHASDTEASATAVLIADLLPHLQVEADASIADALWTGLANDTSWFRNPRTDERSLRCAADLVASGASPSRVRSRLFVPHRPEAKRLLARFLAGFQLLDEGRVAMGGITAEDFAATGAEREEVEGLVEQLRALEGVTLAVMVVEEEPLDGEPRTRLSIRSSSERGALELASAFGGGGHGRAAGATVPASYSDTCSKIAARYVSSGG